MNCDYFDERLYGFKSKVLIKYKIFDLTNIKVFTTKGEFLYTANRVTETHPMAEILRTVTDFEDYKQKIKNTLALLNQLIKHYQALGVIERKCIFQVKRLTKKNKFSINRVIFEGDL